jgi:hypothetical protein
VTDFDIYAVGVLLYLRRFRASRDWRRLWRDLGLLRREIRAREWHHARNSFNGYLAEPIGLPDGDWLYAGRGWTREAAKRNFWRRNKRAGILS